MTFTIRGANAQTLVDDTPTEDGTYSVTYRADNQGEDTVVAGAAEAFSQPATIEITPPEQVGADFQQDSTTSSVETRLNLTMTITPADGSDTGCCSVRAGSRAGVTMTVSGKNGSRELEVSGGPERYTAGYVGGPIPGDDAITATWTGPSGTIRRQLTHTWVQPEVLLTQDTATSRPGDPVLLTATVVPAGSSAPVTFSVTGPEGPLTFRDDGADGTWTATYTRTGKDAGEDTITAAIVGESGTSYTSLPVQHRWDAGAGPAKITTAGGITTCTGSPYSVTFTLTRDGTAVPDTPVRLTVTPAGVPVPPATTDVDGHVTFAYVRPDAGTDTVVADAEVDGEAVTSPPVPHVWQDCRLSVSIAPPGTTSPAGSLFSPTVVVRDADGRPVADAAVDLMITADRPEEQPVRRSLVTGPDGTASTGYSRSAAVTDRLDAVVTAGDRTGRATVQHFWIDTGGLQVTLFPAGTTSVTGSPFTATVLVTRDRRPLPGASVTFHATLDSAATPPQPDIPAGATTGADGLASTTFTRPVAGTDTVTADVVADGRTGRAALVHFWTDVPGLSLTLEPAGTSTVIDTDFTVTATVVDAGEPARGVDVTFAATMDMQPPQGGTSGTDGTGRASFTYRRGTVGPDTVTAAVTLSDGRRGEAAVAHLWKGTDEQAPVLPDPGKPTLDVRGTAVPDGQVTVIGTGCPADTQAQLTVDGQDAGRARAGSDGSYRARVRLAGLGVGAYSLEAVCSPVRVQRTIDVVIPTAATGTAPARVATAAAVLCFFVLLGGQVVRLSGGHPPGTS